MLKILLPRRFSQEFFSTFTYHWEFIHEGDFDYANAEIFDNLSFDFIKTSSPEREISGDVGKVHGVKRFSFLIIECAEMHELTCLHRAGIFCGNDVSDNTYVLPDFLNEFARKSITAVSGWQQ